MCFLFAITVPFMDDQLLELYQTHENSVSAWSDATQSALQAGFILAEDAKDLQSAGGQSTILIS